MRSMTLASVAALAALLAGCSKSSPQPEATGSPSPSGVTQARFAEEYETACRANAEASAELAFPEEDGGTFPPSPPKAALREWAIYFSQLSVIEAQMLSELSAIEPVEEDREMIEELVAARRRAHLSVEVMVEAADGGDTEAFSAAYTEWVADSAEAGRAEEALGIDCAV